MPRRNGWRDKDALQAFKSYLQLKDRNKNLAEDAEGAIVDLALKFYDAGERDYLRDMETGWIRGTRSSNITPPSR